MWLPACDFLSRCYFYNIFPLKSWSSCKGLGCENRTWRWTAVRVTTKALGSILTSNNCSFFASSGALSNKYNPHNSNPTSLCAICSNQKTCPPNDSERYHGYQGAYRCLTEGSGDVAFVNHLTVFEFTGTDNDLNPGRDFKLLCPDGTRAGKFKTQINLVDMQWEARWSNG